MTYLTSPTSFQLYNKIMSEYPLLSFPQGSQNAEIQHNWEVQFILILVGKLSKLL